MSSNAELEVISLNIYGFKINLQTALSYSAIRHEFAYFISENQGVDLLIEQFPLSQANFSRRGLWIGQSRMCDVYQEAFTRRNYAFKRKNNDSIEGLARFQSGSRKKIQIYTDHADLFFEVAYMMILSLSGEFLEKNKIMRLHALAVRKDQKTFCFWGSRKAGKSTLAQGLIDKDSAQIFSDEVTLYDLRSGNILPFPVRIALEQAVVTTTQLQNRRTPYRQYLDAKTMYDVPSHRIAMSSRLDQFVILEARKDLNKISEPKMTEMLSFFPQLLLGTGLIQMWEYMVRPDSLFVLFRILFYRLQLYMQLRKKNFRVWNRAFDLSENWQFFQSRVLRGLK